MNQRIKQFFLKKRHEPALLAAVARRLGVSLPDLRDWCPLLSLQALLEIENSTFPVEEWNLALAYLLGRPCAFSYVFEAKA